MTTSLVLRFAGPMQSWGSSHFYVRNTEQVPTFSGVQGLIAASLGLERGQMPAWLFDIEVWVRVDKAGQQEEDFQTISPPHPDVVESRLRYSRFSPGRKPKLLDWTVPNGALSRWTIDSKVEPMTTWRRYLTDAEFLVAISHRDEERVHQIGEKTREPVFTTYLGRKNCSPTFPYHLGLRSGDPETVLRELPTTAPAGVALALHHVRATRNPVTGRVAPPSVTSESESWAGWSLSLKGQPA